MCFSILPFKPAPEIPMLCSLPLLWSIISGFHVTPLTSPPLILIYKISCKNCISLEHVLNRVRFCFPAMVVSLTQINSKILYRFGRVLCQHLLMWLHLGNLGLVYNCKHSCSVDVNAACWKRECPLAVPSDSRCKSSNHCLQPCARAAITLQDPQSSLWCQHWCFKNRRRISVGGGWSNSKGAILNFALFYEFL